MEPFLKNTGVLRRRNCSPATLPSAPLRPHPQQPAPTRELWMGGQCQPHSPKRCPRDQEMHCWKDDPRRVFRQGWNSRAGPLRKPKPKPWLEKDTPPSCRQHWRIDPSQRWTSKGLPWQRTASCVNLSMQHGARGQGSGKGICNVNFFLCIAWIRLKPHSSSGASLGSQV